MNTLCKCIFRLFREMRQNITEQSEWLCLFRDPSHLTAGPSVSFTIENRPSWVVLVTGGLGWTSMVCSLNDVPLVSMLKDFMNMNHCATDPNL